MHKSLKIFMVTETLEAFWLGYFISIVYFHTMSMTDFHISTFHAVMAIGMLFLDIPTGVFADKTGPKKSIVLGYLALSLAFLTYVLSYFTSFWVAILGASLLFALSNGFRSGASESYIFSLHKRIGKESEYLPYMSRLGLITSISTALAAIVWGYLYTVHPSLPYFIQGILLIVAMVLSLQLENIHIPPTHTINFQTQLKGSLSLLKTQKSLILTVSLLTFSIATFEIFNDIVNQSYWLESGIKVETFGYLGIFIFIINGLIVHQTPWFLRVFGKWVWSGIGVALLGIGIGLYLATSFWSIAILSSLLYGIFSLARRISDKSIQEAIDNESIRASFLSFVSTVSNLVIRGLFFLTVFLLTKYTYRETLFLVCEIFGGITLLLWGVYILKNHLISKIA